MKSIPRLGCNGFTLLELLIAVSIISIVSAGLAATFSVGIKAKKTANQHQEQMGQAKQILSLIQYDLRNMIPNQGGAFSGTEADLTFRSLIPAWGLGDADRLQVQVITFNQSPDDLVIRKHVLAETGSAPADLKLGQGLARLRFYYLSTEGGNDGANWADNWESDSPPAAIRIQIDFAGDNSETKAGTWQRTVLIPVPCRGKEG